MKVIYYKKEEPYNLSVDYGKMMAPSWIRRMKDFLHTDDARDTMYSLKKMYDNEHMAIYPKKDEVFSMLNKMDVTEIDVAIINCDPKFSRRSNGIAFANRISDNFDYDLSLLNLFNKVNTYQKRHTAPSDYSLEHWISQYVFLHNISLTGFASHTQRSMWFGFTRAILESISRGRQGVIFLFVGTEAQCRPYMNMVSHAKHTILRHDTLSYDALNDINLEIDGINGRNYRIKW